MSQQLIAHLAHVEILTPAPEASLRFYSDVLGLEESGRDERSVYLRCWGEWSHHSLQLTQARQPGIGHVGWRTLSAADLEHGRRSRGGCRRRLGWYEDSVGHGPAYRYRGPGGHVHELFWEIEPYVAPEDMRSPFPDRPQRFAPRGIAPRQIDHVT